MLVPHVAHTGEKKFSLFGRRLKRKKRKHKNGRRHRRKTITITITITRTIIMNT